MLVMLQRDFYSEAGQLYKKSRDKVPTPVPNALDGKLPPDAVVVDRKHQLDEPLISLKRGTLAAYFAGTADQTNALMPAEPERMNDEIVGAAHKAADEELAKRRTEFQAKLAAESRGGVRKAKAAS